MLDGLPVIDHAALDRLPLDDQRELLGLLDAYEAAAARDDFLTYMRRTTPGFRATQLHREMAAALMRAERGETKRLLIEVPVRHGKTMMAARRFPAWAMARRRIPVMLASYGGELAVESGGHLRNCILGEAHRSVFPDATMDPATKRADAFALTNGSSFLAAGTGGPIMGRGWKLGVLDDLLKGREAADSKLQRDAVWTWYESDFLSRQEYDHDLDGNVLVFITARWSDDDPAARIRELHARGIEEWEILSYPALDENDNALCEEIVPAKQLKAIRAQVSSRFWGSLYQSNPVAEDGDIFKRVDFLPSRQHWTPEDARNGLIRTYAASDIATQDGAGDYTVHVIFGVDAAGLIHVVDVWRQQAESAVWIREMLDLASAWKPLGWAFGRGALYRMAQPMIRQEMQRRHLWITLVDLPESVDKVARSQTFAALMSNRRVRWRQGADWYAQAESELLRFPAGKHDDVVDACSLIGLMVNSLAPGVEAAPPPPDQPIMVIGRYTDADLPDGMRGVTWREVVDKSMAAKRRRTRARWH